MLKRYFNNETARTIERNLGLHLLYIGALKGHLGVVKLLISDFKVDPNSGRFENDLGCCTPLHLASMHGQTKVVKYLMKINKNDSQVIAKISPTTPLHFAAAGGHLEIVKLLIKLKFNPNARDKQNQTPLHHASLAGKLNIVKYFLEDLELNPDTPGQFDTTPLHCACQSGHLAIAKYLVDECNCNMFSESDERETPLLIASRFGHLDIVKYFVEEKKGNPTSRYFNSFTVLHQAAYQGQVKMLKYFIKTLNCDPNLQGGKYGVTPLHIAADAGQLNAVRFLIEECGCDPEQLSSSRDTPLHFAAEKGHINVVKYLVDEKNCEVLCKNENDETPVYLAYIWHEGKEVHTFLAEKEEKAKEKCHTKPNTAQYPAIHLSYGSDLTIHEAAQIGRNDLIRFLIFYKKVDKYSRNEFGATPLHVAAQHRQMSTVLFLINEAHCNPDYRDNLQRTPLFYAVIGDCQGVFYCLVKETTVLPSFIVEDVFQNQPLHYAAALGHTDMVKMLLETGFLWNTQNIFKMTPLHMAVAGGHFDTASYIAYFILRSYL